MPIAYRSVNDAINLSNHIIIDVRSEGEFTHAHIPGAINMPLFNNRQRAEIGTAYKQQSREKAVDIGLQYFSTRQFELVNALKQRYPVAQEAPTLLIHCARGGMRSQTVAWLFSLYDYRIVVLEGGYKAYRQWVLQQFEKPYQINVLGGFTGSGKTIALQKIDNVAHTHIDLEGLAQHKGSAFGAINMPVQPTQEQFENKLAEELYLKKEKLIWLEDESQRIGSIRIPHAFWLMMRNAPLYFLRHNFDQRLHEIVQQYGSLPIEDLIASTQRITKKLGGNNVKVIVEHLQQQQVKQAFSILLQYYDKTYTHAMQSRPNLQKQLHQIQIKDLQSLTQQ